MRKTALKESFKHDYRQQCWVRRGGGLMLEFVDDCININAFLLLCTKVPSDNSSPRVVTKCKGPRVPIIVGILCEETWVPAL